MADIGLELAVALKIPLVKLIVIQPVDTGKVLAVQVTPFVEVAAAVPAFAAVTKV